MLKFGIPFQSNYNISRQVVYDAFCKYFDNPSLYKIKDSETKSVYMVQIKSLLSSDMLRYVVLVSPKDTYPIGSVLTMTDLCWDSLQTRTLQPVPNIGVHGYQLSRQEPFINPIIKTSSTDEMCNYSANIGGIPLKISILFTKKGNTHEYAPKGTISASLETYNTIITFN